MGKDMHAQMLMHHMVLVTRCLLTVRSSPLLCVLLSAAVEADRYVSRDTTSAAITPAVFSMAGLCAVLQQFVRLSPAALALRLCTRAQFKFN